MSSVDTVSSNLHRQAMAYAKLAESPSVRSSASATSSSSTIRTTDKGDEVGLLAVLPVSAESAGLLPKCTSGTIVYHTALAPNQEKNKKKRNERRNKKDKKELVPFLQTTNIFCICEKWHHFSLMKSPQATFWVYLQITINPKDNIKAHVKQKVTKLALDVSEIF